MPHLNLEYSSNVTQLSDFKDLFRELHGVLAQQGVKLNNCKSRVNKLEHYYIGDGSSNHALVHLEIALLAGRTPDTKQAITSCALEVLQRHYNESLQAYELQISVELRDIERAPYAKFPGGTLSSMP